MLKIVYTHQKSIDKYFCIYYNNITVIIAVFPQYTYRKSFSPACRQDGLGG